MLEQMELFDAPEVRPPRPASTVTDHEPAPRPRRRKRRPHRVARPHPDAVDTGFFAFPDLNENKGWVLAHIRHIENHPEHDQYTALFCQDLGGDPQETWDKAERCVRRTWPYSRLVAIWTQTTRDLNQA